MQCVGQVLGQLMARVCLGFIVFYVGTLACSLHEYLEVAAAPQH